MAKITVRFTATRVGSLPSAAQVERRAGEPDGDLIDRAAAKIYGRGAVVRKDDSLPGCGRVVRPTKWGWDKELTATVQIEIIEN